MLKFGAIIIGIDSESFFNILICSSSWPVEATIKGASLDLEKAFDRILHSAVFDGLQKAGVDQGTVESIKALYENQHAKVQAAGTSPCFEA